MISGYFHCWVVFFFGFGVNSLGDRQDTNLEAEHGAWRSVVFAVQVQ